MANSSFALAFGACPSPFVVGSDYPYVAGEFSGRLCEQSPLDPAVTCCLPCPLSNSIYPNNFDTITLVAQWLGVPALACTVLLLLSFAVLPVQRTSRHYLTICLIIAIVILELAFVVPLGRNPNQCHDKITPNNMRSDISCAFSGAFLLFGGFGGVMWVFIRSLSVHLQICWKYVPGDLFFYAAQIGGWGLTILFTALALTLSGVSYRLGSTCYINNDKSIGSYWGPLLAFVGLSLIMQLITFIYCMKVYLQVAASPKGLPSSNMSGSQATASSGRSNVVRRATYRRIRKVIALQWRGMTVVVLVVITACYLAVVFLLLDQEISNAYADPKAIYPWVICMALNDGNKQQCASLTSSFILSEQVILPIPYLLVLCGFWCLFFLGRWGMVLGWLDLITRPFSRDHRGSSSLTSFSQLSFRERLQSTPQQLQIIRGDGGLSVARKGSDDDIELVASVSPAHSESQFDEDDDYRVAKNVQFEIPSTAPAALERVTPPHSASSNGHSSFNFSRPSTGQLNQHTSPSFPKPALVSPSAHSPLHENTYSANHPSYPQRSASNASETYLMDHPSPIGEVAPVIPLRSLSRVSRNASRNASRTENSLGDSRASHGMAWDSTSSFAEPTYGIRAASASLAAEQSFAARAYADAGRRMG